MAHKKTETFLIMQNSELNIEYLPIIGLEIHVELETNSKMFCTCSAKYFGEQPNTKTCPVCLGLPGALPYPNKKALEYCIKIALALNCKISEFSYFERKNYFYPDLAKGYQISQYKTPFGTNGFLEITVNGEKKKIKIRRVHMEEDTAKLTHQFGNQNCSLIDFNRSGVPLVEIVTEPDIASGLEAKTFLTGLQKIIRYLKVSSADMEKGEMRLEPNISLRKLNVQNSGFKNELPNYKVEIKNINSFRFVEKAINYEIKRQKEILERKETPKQETRGWNQIKNATVSQRIKEEAHDYRYFPEPDIPPIRFKKKDILKIISQIPELPNQKLERFIKQYKLSFYNSEILTRDKTLADYFEETCKIGKSHNLIPKKIADQIINKNIDPEKILPASLVKEILKEKVKEEINGNDLNALIKKILLTHAKAVEDYKNGKIEAVGFLIGMTNKELNGKKVDPQKLKDAIVKAIK